MASELELINLALGHIGQEKLVDDLAADPPSRQLRAARAILPPLRDKMLRAHPWLSATRYRLLRAEAAPVNVSWAYKYGYPIGGDTLRLWLADTCYPFEAGVIEYFDAGGAVQGRRKAILTDDPGPLKSKLIERVDYGDLDAGLIYALSLELASGLVGPLKADKAFAKGLRDEAKVAFMEAAGQETSEFGNECPEIESRWLEARLTGARQ